MPARTGAREVLVNRKPRQQVGDDAARAVELLHRVEAIIKKLRDGAIDALAHPPTEGVVGETRRDGPADRAQMISRVPGISIRSISRQIAIGVVAVRGAVELGLRIVGIVRRTAARHVAWQGHHAKADCSRAHITTLKRRV